MHSPRRLIVCCDGTGSEIEEHQSNVLKFYKCLELDEEQVGYYDPGVGTLAREGAWSRFQSRASGVLGLATGAGLDDNVLDAYRFLVRHYRDGDRIYLFGFSRGAYTVRILAGLVHMAGVVRPENENLLPYLLTAYKRASATDDFRHVWRFEEMLRTRRATVRFMGCWDTVASVIVPRPDRLYLPALETRLPYTCSNPSVQCFRHALAIDERRRFFRPLHWKEGQMYKVHPFQKDERASPQDCVQEWFAGVHADIGGGYPEKESGPAKHALAWMVDESRSQGLAFREVLVKRLVHGKNPAGSRRQYAEPSASAPLHDSLTGLWRLLEWLPRKRKASESKDRRRGMLGWYLPRGELRVLPPNARIHPSAQQRRGLDVTYRPANAEPFFNPGT